MAFTNITLDVRASDLLVGTYQNNFNNDEANITPPAASAPIPFGTIVFRAKGLGKAAAWAAVTAAGNLASTNEYAVVWGDNYGFKANFVPRAIAAGKYNAIVIKRGPAEFKEFYIKQVHGTALGATNFDILKQLLADQGLVVLTDVTKLTA